MTSWLGGDCSGTAMTNGDLDRVIEVILNCRFG